MQVIHRLSSGPCPHSEIYDCCHQLAETTENLAEKLLEEILAEVGRQAGRHEGTAVFILMGLCGKQNMSAGTYY